MFNGTVLGSLSGVEIRYGHCRNKYILKTWEN